MHSSLTRIQNVFGFFTTVLTILGALIAATDLVAPRAPSGILKPNALQVVKGRANYYSAKKEESAIIRFSLDADLSSLFTWNTKQLFVYVTADWTSPDNSSNSAVIWDAIITNPSADHLRNIGPIAMKKLLRSADGKTIDPSRGLLKLKNQKPKYQITHPSGRIAETTDVQLVLHYNVQPWVGLLSWNAKRDFGRWKALAGGPSEPFALPALKPKEAKKKTKAKPDAGRAKPKA